MFITFNDEGDIAQFFVFVKLLEVASLALVPVLPLNPSLWSSASGTSQAIQGSELSPASGLII